MTKEEKIKEAWEELMPDYTNIDLNSGWSLNDFYEEDFNDIDFDTMQIYTPCKIRPKSLQGMENNNGWIKIESEDDLPTPELKKEYYFISLEKNTSKSEIIRGFTDKTGKYFICSESYRTIFYNDTFYKITHYQSIQKPKSPMY